MAEPVSLPITLVATLACLVLNLWADVRIGRAQQLVRRGRADAAALLAARQTAAGALRGNALFVLILILLLELGGASAPALAVPVALFVAARAMLIAGADITAGPARSLGVTVTLLIEGLLALGAAAATCLHLAG